jgi:hypothetical protein
VAIKVLNAQHWALGAQEHERMRQLWRAFSRSGTTGVRVARPLHHFEDGAHFCIVFDILSPLDALSVPPAALPPPQAAVATAGGALVADGVISPRTLSHATAASAGALAGGVGARGRGIALLSPPIRLVGGSSAGGGGRKAGIAADGGGAIGKGAVAAAAATLPERPHLTLSTLRHAACQLLGALASLHSEGVLHADLKPENIMVDADVAQLAPSLGAGAGGGARAGWLGDGVRLIDFSNAMGRDETGAYHDTFEVQTLGYRAPEVLYGLAFDTPIDMWSLGTTLAELYSGRALVHASSRGGLAVEYSQLLGQPPRALYGSGKFSDELLQLVAHTQATGTPAAVRERLASELSPAPPTAEALQLVDLISQLLSYDPAARPTAQQALCHPFLAPLFPFRSILGTAGDANATEQKGPAKLGARRSSGVAASSSSADVPSSSKRKRA